MLTWKDSLVPLPWDSGLAKLNHTNDMLTNLLMTKWEGPLMKWGMESRFNKILTGC